MKDLLITACQRLTVVAAVRVALVVGTVLNLINQGGPLLEGMPPSWFHMALNYLVPYCVSSYSAARNELRREGEVARRYGLQPHQCGIPGEDASG